MKIGYFSTLSAAGITAQRLAQELETRGFESLWVPEHSHIPVQRAPTPAFGRDVPEAYVHLLDPYVCLAGAATVTERLVVGTGVALPLQHDLLDLASRVATLDVLSEGRLRFGVGAGWLPEELSNHRPDIPFRERYAALIERVAALRVLWSDDEASFEGRWHRFPPVWLNPKPRQQPLPIGMGFSGGKGIAWAARHADEWYPIDAVLGLVGGPAAGIELFHQAAAEVGRDPAVIPITLFLWGWEPGVPSVDYIRSLRELPIERVVIPPPTNGRHSESVTLRRLDEYASLLIS